MSKILTIGISLVAATVLVGCTKSEKPIADCPPKHGCVYDMPNGGGWREDITSHYDGDHCYDFTKEPFDHPHDNQMSSSTETIPGKHFRFYDLHDCKGRFWDQDDDTLTNWTDFPSHQDNIASSWMLVSNSK